VHWIPFSDALEWALDGRIRDAKTVIGLLRALHVDTSQQFPGRNIP
jgi:hypothetical protein